MEKLLLGALLAGVFSQMAFATTTDELKIVSGSTTIVVTDNGALDLNPASGFINYSNADVNGWGILLTMAISGSPDTDPGLDLTSITATCDGVLTTGCAADPLHIIFSDIDFDAIVTSFNTTYSSTQTGAGTTSQSAYLDTGNVIFNEATLIGTNGPFSMPGGIGNTSIVSSAGPNPYSLTLDQVFTDGGAVSFSVDGNVSGVPEPGAVVLFGTVLALSALKLRRHRASTQ